MKPYLIFFILICTCTMGWSQSARLMGSVKDAETKVPLELATVTILGKDSSVIAYQLSDKNGKFIIERLPLKKKLIVTVSYTGYSNYDSTILFETTARDTLSILLQVSSKNINEVIVTTAVPVRMNGDTLEINPAAFKMKENAVVEELLNQLTGITIWSDGSITVNGKKVQSLLVDGKPFMGSTDSRIATQNLPKTAIEKIQLYQEYDRSNINQQTGPQDSLLTMNIKLKENSKKGYFGKAGAGYGNTSRFESDLTLQTYNKKSSGGIGGGFNNINKNIGNLQELFQNNTYRNYNPNLYNVGRFGTNGINKSHSIGGIYTHNFIESTNSRQNNRISANYNKSGTDTYITDVNLQNRTAIGNPQLIHEEGVNNNRQNRHDLGVNYVRTSSYNDNLNINGAVNFSDDNGSSSRSTEVTDASNTIQSTNVTTSRLKRSSDNASVNVSFARSTSDDPLKGFTINLNARRGNTASERDVSSLFQSFTNSSKNISNQRHYTTNNQSFNLGGTLDYAGFKRLLLGRYNLFGIGVNFTQTFNYAWMKDNNIVNDYDSTAKQYTRNGALSNNNKKEIFDYTPALALSKHFPFRTSNDRSSRYVSLQLRLLNEFKTDKNVSSFVKRNLTRSFYFPRYEGSINYQRQIREKYQYYISLSHSKNYEYPSIDQLYTIVDDINVYDTRVGNPLLRNRSNSTTNMYANFGTQNPRSNYTINTNIGLGIRSSFNPVTDSVINDFSGKRMHYYINADKSDNLFMNYSFNYSRKLKKSELQVQYNGQFNTGSVPNYIDGIENISETENLSNQFNIQFTLRSRIILNVGQSFQRYKTKQSASGLNAFKNSSSSTKLGIVVNIPTRFSFSSTADYVSNSNLNKPTILWNAFATHRILKDQGELKLSAMDLLKQYQNISNSVTPYGTITRITNGLQQYFLLTFSYFPRKFGKTEIKRQSN